MFFAAGFVSSLALAGYVNRQGPIFYVVSILGAVLHLFWQYAMIDFENPHGATRKP